MSNLVPPAKLHVVFAAHLTGEQLLGYENALALSGSLIHLDNPREFVVEIHDADRLDQHRHMLPHWERSGVCSAW